MGDATDAAARLARSWEKNADAWTRLVRGGRIESRRLGTDRAILEAVLAHGPRRVLDLGCGEGWLCRALADRGVEAVGVDASAALVAAAGEKGGATFHTLSFDALAARPAQLGAAPFDVIAANFALLHEDVHALLSTLRSMLGPGGVLAVQTLHPWAARGEALYADGWRTERFDGFDDGAGSALEPMPWYYRTLGSWVAALRRAGLSVRALHEPLHPETRRPLSLLLIAAAMLPGDDRGDRRDDRVVV